MHRIEFSSEELEVLREMLQRSLTEVDVEVFSTDTHDFKEMLKHRRDILGRILAKVSALPLAA